MNTQPMQTKTEPMPAAPPPVVPAPPPPRQPRNVQAFRAVPGVS